MWLMRIRNMQRCFLVGRIRVRMNRTRLVMSSALGGTGVHREAFGCFWQRSAKLWRMKTPHKPLGKRLAK